MVVIRSLIQDLVVIFSQTLQRIKESDIINIITINISNRCGCIIIILLPLRMLLTILYHVH